MKQQKNETGNDSLGITVFFKDLAQGFGEGLRKANLNRESRLIRKGHREITGEDVIKTDFIKFNMKREAHVRLEEIKSISYTPIKWTKMFGVTYVTMTLSNDQEMGRSIYLYKKSVAGYSVYFDKQ